MKRVFAVIVAIILLVSLAACKPPAEERYSFDEIGSAFSAEREAPELVPEPESAPSVTTDSASETSAGPILTHETGEYREYQYTTTVGKIVRYGEVTSIDGTCTYNITFPRNLHLKSSIIYRAGQKVGELCPAVLIEDDESFSDLFDATNGENEFNTQIETGTYKKPDGNTVYYEIHESNFEFRVFCYAFLVPLEENTAAWIYFMVEEYNRSEDEPLFRSIAETITPAEQQPEQ